jgi:phosphoribosylglycinamide formyltransferase 1
LASAVVPDAAPRARVVVAISGRGSNMAALLYASRLPGSPFEIVRVVADNPDAAGLVHAAAEGIATVALTPPARGERALFEAALTAAVADADIVALAGFMRVLSADFVAAHDGRLVNIHPSLLPAHKGLHTHEAVLAAGETVSGATVHRVTATLDDGPILGQVRVAVLPGDTPDSLAARVMLAEHQLYPRIIAELAAAPGQPDALLAEVRARALALPSTVEKLSHGSPGFHVEGGKFFAYFNHDHHHDGITGLLVKASGVEEQAQLIENDPDLYYRPAYLGPSGWIGIRLDTGSNDWDHINAWLTRSWRVSAPKRLAAMFEL